MKQKAFFINFKGPLTAKNVSDLRMCFFNVFLSRFGFFCCIIYSIIYISIASYAGDNAPNMMADNVDDLIIFLEQASNGSF